MLIELDLWIIVNSKYASFMLVELKLWITVNSQYPSFSQCVVGGAHMTGGSKITILESLIDRRWDK